MKKDKDLDELFRDKLLNYEQEPPAYLLGNILNRVAEERRKKRMIWWRVAGVAAALMIAFVAGWQLKSNHNRESDQSFVAEKNTVQGKITQPEILTEAKTAQVQTTEVTADQAVVAVGSSSQKQTNQLGLIQKNQTSATDEEATEETTTPDNLIVLIPLKSLYKQLQYESESQSELRQVKKADDQQALAGKSIDQQIMEHNRQMMLAENKTKEKARWLVSALITPEYNVSRSSHTQRYASNMLASSASSSDLAGGISVELKKGKRWSIQSGVYYSGIDQSARNKSASEGKNSLDASSGSNYFNTPVNLSPNTTLMTMNSRAGVIELNKIPPGLILGTSLEDKSFASSVIVSPTSFIQNFDYIEIPLYLRYTLIDTRVDVVMLGGFSSNLLVGNQIFVEDVSGKSLVGKTQDMETLNYSGTLGLGFRYGLSKRISLNIEPRIKYYLKSLNSNSSVTYKPYTIGVFTGLSYEF